MKCNHLAKEKGLKTIIVWLGFFFEWKQEQEKKIKYLKSIGVIPNLKAGLHMGLSNGRWNWGDLKKNSLLRGCSSIYYLTGAGFMQIILCKYLFQTACCSFCK